MNSEFCFCGLAIGKLYRDFAINLAGDLNKFYPGIEYVVITDKPEEFHSINNVTAVRQRQSGIMFPFQDRRFAVEEALKNHRTACQLDTDTRILKPLPLPKDLDSHIGMTCFQADLIKIINRWQPENLKYYAKIAEKFHISLDRTPLISEFLFIISRDNGREKKFIDCYGKIGRYLELHKVCGGDAPTIGLAAVAAGYQLNNAEWIDAASASNQYVYHFKASSGGRCIEKKIIEKLIFRIAYHYRLNLTRLKALKDFRFYYGENSIDEP